MELTYYYNELPGRRVGYTNKTVFYVQTGKKSNAYKNKHKVVGNLDKAISLFEEIKLANKHKKRLIMVGTKKPVIFRKIRK